MGVKVSILEQDGVELFTPTEYELSIFDVLPKDLIPSGIKWTIPIQEQLVLINRIEMQGDIEVNGTLGVL